MMNRSPETTEADGNGNGSRPSVDTHLTTVPLPASKKLYVEGRLQGMRVPMREISVGPTRSSHGGNPSPNQPVIVYDTSGPYTDPAAKIDIRSGLAPQRLEWILGRQDVEELPEVSSAYGRLRATDPKLATLRFQHVRKPLRAQSGRNVT